MFTTPYATTPLQGYSHAIAKIMADVSEAKIAGDLPHVQSSKGKALDTVYEVPPYVKAVGHFAHPLVMAPYSPGLAPDVVIDTRAFVRVDASKNVTLASGQKPDYDFSVLYARLTSAWTRGYANDFKALGKIAPTVFIRWIAESIVARLNLTPFDQVGVTVVTGYYFYNLFMETEPSGSDKLKIAQQVSRATMIPAATVTEYIDNIKTTPVCSKTFVAALSEAVDTTRFDKFSVALLYQIISNVWFGAHAAEIAAVALEYPPAFYAMLYTALNDRGYRRSQFGERVNKAVRGTEGEEFSLALARLIEV